MQHDMPANGAFCWNELATKDAAAAKKFYAELLGWRFKESTATADCASSMPYSEIHVGDSECGVGGLYQMTSEFGDAPSHWMAYVAVDDVDAKADRVKQLGGSVCVPPTDIPNVGRFCVINDPTGATISLIKLTGAGS
ncbi:MAG TPA: VOC family protein [Pyrinomonadaceae bacterium]|nr:VOC family protein [Pyrinomonadaceae bacterium]